MNVAIIGCGLMGQKRAKALQACNLVACVDVMLERAQALAIQFPNCAVFTQWQDILYREDIHMVIISTIHESLSSISLAMLNAGKHILIEKPAGRCAAELEPVIAMANKMHLFARVGFNHRYHRAICKARELITANAIGDLLFIRGCYGHGGRLGYDKEWRANPVLSGGGELIDQGIHLIDLARWFLGEFTEIHGFAHTYFWDMPVDDNGFMLLKTQKKQVAYLHASSTEWKNKFSFEIYGQKGKIEVNGLGGSYGVERVAFYKMTDAMGPPETFIWEYPMLDNSWNLEMDEFIQDIKEKRQPSASLQDARAALQIVEEIYRQSQS